MKGFLTQDKNLITLPKEKVVGKINGVYSVNNDQATLGTYYLTNVRIIWYSSNMDNFNVSLPWIQIRLIKTKDFAKNGKCVCIETGKSGVSNIFYFKFNETLESVIKDIEINYQLNVNNPILGVDLSNNNNNSQTEIKVTPNTGVRTNSTSSTNVNSNTSSSQLNNNNNNQAVHSKKKKTEDEFSHLTGAKHDDVEIIETNYFNEQSNMLYYMTSNQERKNAITDIVYSHELGLAIEKLPDKSTLESLWKIIV